MIYSAHHLQYFVIVFPIVFLNPFSSLVLFLTDDF